MQSIILIRPHLKKETFQKKFSKNCCKILQTNAWTFEDSCKILKVDNFSKKTPYICKNCKNCIHSGWILRKSFFRNHFSIADKNGCSLVLASRKFETERKYKVWILYSLNIKNKAITWNVKSMEVWIETWMWFCSKKNPIQLKNIFVNNFSLVAENVVSFILAVELQNPSVEKVHVLTIGLTTGTKKGHFLLQCFSDPFCEP